MHWALCFKAWFTSRWLWFNLVNTDLILHNFADKILPRLCLLCVIARQATTSACLCMTTWYHKLTKHICEILKQRKPVSWRPMRGCDFHFSTSLKLNFHDDLLVRKWHEGHNLCTYHITSKSKSLSPFGKHCCPEHPPVVLLNGFHLPS